MNNDMKSILYIHGFNSAGGAFKAQKLKEFYPDYKIVAPTLNYYDDMPDKIMVDLIEICRKEKIDVVVGTSLGGLMSMSLSAFIEIPCLAINPAAEPQVAMRKFIGPNENLVTHEVHMLTEEGFDRFKNYVDNVFSKLTFNSKQLVFALSTDDEVLGNYDKLKDNFKNFEIHEFDGTGHRFFQFELLKPIIDNLLNRN